MLLGEVKLLLGEHCNEFESDVLLISVWTGVDNNTDDLNRNNLDQGVWTLIVFSESHCF